MNLRTLLYASAILLLNTVVKAQLTDRQLYIAEYSQIAVDEMNRSGIPASITLAQAVLESGNGKSELASKSNNHFGIKCHSNWDGGKVFHDDDEKGECFRKYNKVRHSYEDHSDFLVRGSRYAFLFDLEPDDYKGWAKGLKQAGYATAPDYADRLIRIIEEEQLYRFDRGGAAIAVADNDTLGGAVQNGPTLNRRGKVVTNPRAKYIIHRVIEPKKESPYVVLKEGESIEAVADSLGLPLKALLAFNDAGWDRAFRPGAKVYVDYKRNRGTSEFELLRAGEDLFAFSQRVGVKLEKIFEINEYRVGHVPLAGEKIYLHKRAFRKAHL
ncbi:MAG: hypothetical protein RL754_1162 [Bacteroidota bacterium]|jgi:hypothetical protein